MSRWWRVFGSSGEQPSPAALLEHLRGLGIKGRASFRGDAAGWWEFEFSLTENGSPLLLACHLSTEKGIRSELNSWAAWLESCEGTTNHAALMERVVLTRQLYTLCVGGEQVNEMRVSESLCRFLAGRTAGMYQFDGAGLYAADGLLLVSED